MRGQAVSAWPRLLVWNLQRQCSTVDVERNLGLPIAEVRHGGRVLTFHRHIATGDLWYLAHNEPHTRYAALIYTTEDLERPRVQADAPSARPVATVELSSRVVLHVYLLSDGLLALLRWQSGVSSDGRLLELRRPRRSLTHWLRQLLPSRGARGEFSYPSTSLRDRDRRE